MNIFRGHDKNFAFYITVLLKNYLHIMEHFYCILMFPLKHHIPVSSSFISIVIISIDIMSVLCSVVS